MKINKLEKETNIATLEIEEDYKKVEEAIEKAYKILVKDAKIKGFRQGKAPRPIFERYYGKEILIERASSIVINEIYPEILKESELHVIDYPKDVNVIQLEEGKPFKFILKVETKPEVKLGEYKGLKVEKEKIQVNQEEIDNHVNQICERFAEYTEVSDRAVQEEDIIRYDIKATVDGNVYEKWSKDNSGTRIGMTWISEDFDNQLKGIKIGEEKKFILEFKEDYKEVDIAGKKVEFEVKIKEIREKKLPSKDDKLAKKLSQDKFNKWDEFIEDFKKQMEEQKKINVENKLKGDLIALAVEKSSVDVPETMIKREVESMFVNLDSTLKQSNVDLNYYMQMAGKDKNALEEEYRLEAIKKIKETLVLDKIAQEEKTEVTDVDVEEEIKRMANESKKDYDEFQKGINEDFKNYIKMYLKDKKTIDILIDNAKIKEK